MAIFDFNSDVNNIDFFKNGTWFEITCPTGVPTAPAASLPQGTCNVTTIYTYNGKCYQCMGIQDSSPKKLMIDGVIKWAKMTLYFDENGGSAVSNKTVYFGRNYGTLPVTTLDGYTLIGWYTAEDWSTKIEESTKVTEIDDHTLHARLVYAPYIPTITYVSKDSTSITFTLKSNSPYSERIYYEHSDSTPDANYVDLAAGETVTRSLSGLTANTQYVIYASAYKVGYSSSSSSITITTLPKYTITWKAHDGTTLKTDVLNYGQTSNAPTGTSDDAQWDYSWPISSVVATQNQTINETRAIKSYHIIWKSYSGAILKDETLNYGTISTAPTGTADTAQYDYSWPKASTTVVGDEVIGETRALRYYTITFKSYAGVTLSSSSIAYGTTPTPPSGTADNAQWDYSWPTITSVTGTKTYTETRAIKSYVVTWKDWNGTTLKTETVDYGGNGTPPTQPTRTGFTFDSWSGDYTGITGAVIITATYNVRTYPLTISTSPAYYTTYVNRTSSPNGGTTGYLSNGATLYYGDVLYISISGITAGYNMNQTSTTRTVSSAINTGGYFTYTYVVATPSVTEVSKTTTSITFTVKNNNTAYGLRVYYEIGDSTPDASYVDLAAGATSSNITISNLAGNTAYTVYARSNKDGTLSSVASRTITTLIPGPTGWASTTSTSYMDTININVNYSLGIYNTNYTGCATTQNILGFLPDPSSYDFDDIVRIRVNSTNNPPKNLTFNCSTYRYYKAV